MQHTITLQDISETEQLVFRLIFSLSEKVAGRLHSYKLCEPGSASGAILIRGGQQLQDVTAGSFIQYIDDAGQTAQSAYIINKPLIATRVLAVLDRYVAQEQAPQVVEAPTSATPNVESAELPEVDFCISEEEASELAIVEDEALANPANQPAAAEITVTGEAMSAPAKPALLPQQPTLPVNTSSLLMFQRARAADIPDVTVATEVEVSKRPRALVVDDSPSVRKQLELELDLFDVDVDFAADVAQARQMLGAHDYDVAFLDVVLPDGDGFAICRSIKQETKQVNVVMLTGKATPADKIKGTMAGCDAYLVKPVGRMTFQNTVCKYLQLREQAEAIQA